MNTQYDVIIVGGGAAGFFTAINIAENDPGLKIVILERGTKVLTKVKVSGGGRCNVTHAEFEPKELSLNYPRGEKELLGPFHRFMTGDTIDWFARKGIELVAEEDGRMFPVSNSSQTIIDCFVSETKRLGIEVLTNHIVQRISKQERMWSLSTSEGELTAHKIVLATGSNLKVWKLLESLGHTIETPVPSLFTFNIKDERIEDLPGISTQAGVKVLDEQNKELLESEGPLLITHWGMSGPAILKLSAWGARLLEPFNYHFKIKINWLVDVSEDAVLNDLKELKTENPKQNISKYTNFELPKRLWQHLTEASGIISSQKWAETTNLQLEALAKQLTNGVFEVNGKSTFKEEFVTAGGVNLKEVNFKTFESKILKNLYFAGEVLNIDAITGGFNFQNAWTGAYLVAQAITSET